MYVCNVRACTVAKRLVRIKMKLGILLGLGPGHIVYLDVLAGTWHGGRPQPGRLCVRWRPSPPLLWTPSNTWFPVPIQVLNPKLQKQTEAFYPPEASYKT